MQAVGASRQALQFTGDAAIFGDGRIWVDIGGRKKGFRSLEFFLNRRLLAGDEFSHDKTVLKRAFALFVASLGDPCFDGSESEAIGDVEVREIFADRPAARL